MKNLAEFKRRIQAGVAIATIFYDWKRVKENDVETLACIPKDLGVRKIHEVYSASCNFMNSNGELSWLHFPKASECRFIDADTMEIHWVNPLRKDGSTLPKLRYTFIKTEEEKQC